MTVLGVSRGYRHRSMAIDAEVIDLRLALTALVHREKQGVVRGIRVHAPRPFAVVAAWHSLQYSGSLSCSIVAMGIGTSGVASIDGGTGGFVAAANEQQEGAQAKPLHRALHRGTHYATHSIPSSASISAFSRSHEFSFILVVTSDTNGFVQLSLLRVAASVACPAAATSRRPDCRGSAPLRSGARAGRPAENRGLRCRLVVLDRSRKAPAVQRGHLFDLQVPRNRTIGAWRVGQECQSMQSRVATSSRRASRVLKYGSCGAMIDEGARR